MKEEKALMGFKEALLIRFPNLVKSLILFGSKARGDSSEWSDVDLLVIVSDKDEREDKVFSSGQAYIDPFLRNVQREGISL